MGSKMHCEAELGNVVKGKDGNKTVWRTSKARSNSKEAGGKGSRRRGQKQKYIFRVERAGLCLGALLK